MESPPYSPVRLQFDDFHLDEANARLQRAGLVVNLAPKAFALLCALARQPGKLVSKNELLDSVWGHQHFSESVLKTVVSELRAALSDDSNHPRYIETVPRRGYRFIGVSRPITAPTVQLSVCETQSTIVGRAAALEQLHSSWANVNKDQREITWIVGDAGIGKTTLIDHFVSNLGSVTYARGQCVEQYGAGEPYLPVLEALGALCRQDSQLVSRLRTVAPTWFMQLPWLSDEASRIELNRELAGVGQNRMLREFGELLDQFTQQRPLLLVTEDLHWSDHATIHLINHVARRRSPARYLWLCSFRLDQVIAEDHPLKALRHELRLHRLCNEIALDPFSERDLETFLGLRFPDQDISEAFIRTLHEQTEGLPLFVVNVLDELNIRDVLDTTSLKRLQVPESLSAVIEKHSTRLAVEDRAILDAASVCGVDFRSTTVAAALDRDIEWVTQRCDDMARHQHWLSGPAVARLANGALDLRYAFRHALYRHVLYQRLGELSRSTLHGRVAAALERARESGVPVTSAELALHYDKSHAALPALRHYTAAAQSALRHFAPREALELVARAMEHLPRCAGDQSRAGLELTLRAMHAVAATQSIGVSSIEAKQSFQRAKELLPHFPEHPLTGLVLNGLGHVLLVRSEYVEANALGNALLELAEQRRDPVLLLCAGGLLGQVATLMGKHHDGANWFRTAIDAASSIEDESLQTAFIVDPLTTFHGAHAMALLRLGRINESRASVATARTRSQRFGQPMPRLVAYWFSALLEIQLGNVAGVADYATKIRAITDDAALAQGEGPSLWFRGWAEAYQGAPVEGFRKIRAAFEHNTGMGMYSGSPEVLGFGVEACLLANDLVQAQIQLDEAMQLALRLGEHIHVPQLHLLGARIETARNNPSGARESLVCGLTEARNQSAPWLILNALLALCELDGAGPAELDALREVRKAVQGGEEIAAVKKADSILQHPG